MFTVSSLVTRCRLFEEVKSGHLAMVFTRGASKNQSLSEVADEVPYPYTEITPASWPTVST